MTDDADALLEEAGRGKERLLEEARAEVARWIDAASAAGGEEGQAQAQHMRDEIAGLETRMLKEVESEVVRTAVRVAAELLAAELLLREDAVVDIAITALVAAKNARDINLRVNPRDAKVLRAAKERLVSNLTRAKDLEIREDRRVHVGGVLIETEAGVIDAQLETQLEEIARVLGA
ncbi:MAG: FliH/SctL family protein [Deltaproteobacteria bacterium]|nr:FliH/SctL family protein [Deltaproteobacteria bacterium]